MSHRRNWLVRFRTIAFVITLALIVAVSGSTVLSHSAFDTFRSVFGASFSTQQADLISTVSADPRGEMIAGTSRDPFESSVNIEHSAVGGNTVKGANPLGEGSPVPVSLPDATAVQNIRVPLTVGDLTGRGVTSYQFQITYDGSSVASLGVSTTGTVSEGMTVTATYPIMQGPGHLIVTATGPTTLSGSGTLINLDFASWDQVNMRNSVLIFQDYTDPANVFHPGFRFNDGEPPAMTTNGSIILFGPPTPTNTATTTPTATPTFTPTPNPTPCTVSPSKDPSDPTAVSTCPTATPTETPVIFFSPTSFAENESQTAAITVKKLFATTHPVFATLSTADATAIGGTACTAGVDYISVNDQEIVFNPGETLKMVNVTICPDGLAEPDETIVLSLAGAFVVSPRTAVLTIHDTTVVSGTVTYGNALGAPATRFVSNVTITGSGSQNVTTSTGPPGPDAGQYTLFGFGAGPYTVTPSKTGNINASITSFDAARISQHAAGVTSLTGNQLVVADVSGNGTLSSFDAAEVAKYVAAVGGSGSTGNWIFAPVNRMYPSVPMYISGQDFTGLLMGEVSGNWTNSGARPLNTHGPEKNISVELPSLVASGDKEIIVPVHAYNVADKEVISFEFDLRYDPSVIQPLAEPIDVVGSVSRGFSYVTNSDEPGLFRVVMYGPLPIDKDGLLLNLRFTAVGADGSVSPVSFERFMFNEDRVITATDGQIRLSTAVTPTATVMPTFTPTNTVTSTPTNTATPTDTPTATPSEVPIYDLTIGQSDSPDPVHAAQELTYTVHVSNDPARGHGATLCPSARFDYPSGVPFVFVSAIGTHGYFAVTDASGITFGGGCISSSGGEDRATLTIVIRPLSAGTLTSLGSGVVVDPDNSIPERFEDNNTAQTITTTILTGNPTSTPTATPTNTATATNTPTSTPTSTPERAAFDYDGDRKSDVSVFRPAGGDWYFAHSAGGFFGMHFGVPDDKIAPADYDGDGKTDIAVYRPATGIWYVLNSSDGTFAYYPFGLADDLPTPADYDGDKKADLSVFRPSTGTWYRQNSSDDSFYGVQFGASEDKPTVGDFDGDKKSDIAVFRPSSGAWYRINSSDTSLFGELFGVGSDILTPGDYDGDGKTDLAVYRPSTGIWYTKNSSDSSYAYNVFGLADDIPAPADFDGDGKADISVFRPSDGTWYRQNSSDGTFAAFPFGTNGDKPTQTAFRY